MNRWGVTGGNRRRNGLDLVQDARDTEAPCGGCSVPEKFLPARPLMPPLMQLRRSPKFRRGLFWIAILPVLPALALISTVPAQNAPPPSQRSSPFERTPGDPPSTPTPIPQTSFAPAPAVVLPDSDRRGAPPKMAGGNDDEELSLEIQNEPDGPYVTFTELLRIIRRVDSKAQARWDGLLGVFRIESSGHSLQVLSNQPVVVADGRTIPVSKPIRVRGGVALVPASSINTIFQALDFDFALPESLGGTATSASEPDGEAPAGSAGTPQRRPRPSLLSAQDALLPDVGGGTAMAQLDIPQVDASVAGLTWAELTDYAHPRAPQRLTIVYDAPFHSLADALGRVAQRTGLPEVSLIRVENRRDDPALLTRVSQSRPEILLDLMATGIEDRRKFEVWTVHEALWTPAAKNRADPARLMHELYVVHQFHNLALGSVLRAELAKSFPDGTVRHELSPCYLLRRVDAPSAAIVIPEELAEGDDRELERVARALAGGFAGYYRGVKSATN